MSDEQIKDLWNKIQNQKDYSFTGGVRVIEQAVRNATLDEVAQMIDEDIELSRYNWHWAERVRQMKEGKGNG